MLSLRGTRIGPRDRDEIWYFVDFDFLYWGGGAVLSQEFGITRKNIKKRFKIPG